MIYIQRNSETIRICTVQWEIAVALTSAGLQCPLMFILKLSYTAAASPAPYRRILELHYGLRASCVSTVCTWRADVKTHRRWCRKYTQTHIQIHRHTLRHGVLSCNLLNKCVVVMVYLCSCWGPCLTRSSPLSSPDWNWDCSQSVCYSMASTHWRFE